ncbi:MAG: hypothetical protein DRO67_05770 [Candidatus Asgardarchaeum californiense]|nr:MAG: hypothetical protein DRO67_05770 [Candidatus Asgardarchaeum californiense]
MIVLAVHDYIFKVVLIGDGAVGKTSLRLQYMGKGFSATYLMTIGADFAVAPVTINYDNHNYSCKLQIWDLAGQPRFKEVRSLFYQGAYGALAVYDKTRYDTYEHVIDWVNEVIKNRGKIPMVLLGNKKDICDDQAGMITCIGYDEGVRLAKKLSEMLGFEIPFYETSAKTGENVNEAFTVLTQAMVANALKKK